MQSARIGINKSSTQLAGYSTAYHKHYMLSQRFAQLAQMTVQLQSSCNPDRQIESVVLASVQALQQNQKLNSHGHGSTQTTKKPSGDGAESTSLRLQQSLKAAEICNNEGAGVATGLPWGRPNPPFYHPRHHDTGPAH